VPHGPQTVLLVTALACSEGVAMQPARSSPLSLSQNFLTSRALVDRLLTASSIRTGDGRTTSLLARRVAAQHSRWRALWA